MARVRFCLPSTPSTTCTIKKGRAQDLFSIMWPGTELRAGRTHGSCYLLEVFLSNLKFLKFSPECSQVNEWNPLCLHAPAITACRVSKIFRKQKKTNQIVMKSFWQKKKKKKVCRCFKKVNRRYVSKQIQELFPAPQFSRLISHFSFKPKHLWVSWKKSHWLRVTASV